MATWKDSVRLASTGNIPVGPGTTTPATIDDVVVNGPPNADRILLKDQTNPVENGIYIAGTPGVSPLTRATDMQTGAATDVTEVTVRVSEGSVNAHTQYILTTPSPSVGATALRFEPHNPLFVGVRAATTASIEDLASPGAIDGINPLGGSAPAFMANDRVLVKDQTTPTQNGIYVVNATGGLDRAADTLTNGETTVRVSGGTQNVHTMWSCVVNSGPAQFSPQSTVYNVLDFGAVPSWLGDYVNGFDCTPVIQSILAAMGPGGGVIYFPGQRKRTGLPPFGYRFSSRLVFPVTVCLCGDETPGIGDTWRSIIWFDEGVPGLFFQSADEASPNPGGVYSRVRDLMITSPRGVHRWGKGMRASPMLNNAHYPTVIVPSFSNGYQYRCITEGIAADSEPAWPTTVGSQVNDGSIVWQCEPASDASLERCTTLWERCYIRGFTGNGRYIQSATENLWICDLWKSKDCWYEGNGLHGLWASGPDANAGVSFGDSFRVNGWWGYHDTSWAGCTIIGYHVDANGAVSWGSEWCVPVGVNIVPRPPNGYVYRSTAIRSASCPPDPPPKGRTGLEQPTWPTTVGLTVDDGEVTWECIAKRDVGNLHSNSGVVIGGYDEGQQPPIDLGQAGIFFGATANGIDPRNGHHGRTTFTRDVTSLGGAFGPVPQVNRVPSGPTGLLYSTTLGDDQGQAAFEFHANKVSGKLVRGYALQNVGGFWALWGGSGDTPLMLTDDTGEGYQPPPFGHVTTPNGIWIGHSAYKNRLYSHVSPPRDGQHWGGELCLNAGFSGENPIGWISNTSFTGTPPEGTWDPIFSRGGLGPPISVDVSGGSMTLNPDQAAESGMIIATGAPGAAVTVTIGHFSTTGVASHAGRPFVLVNRTSGFAVTFQLASGTGVTVASGKTCTAMGDGTNLIRTGPDV